MLCDKKIIANCAMFVAIRLPIRIIYREDSEEDNKTRQRFKFFSSETKDNSLFHFILVI
jgi:hypothetical protein